MLVMVGAEQVLHLVGVGTGIHRNGEDVLDRALVVYLKAILHIFLQLIAVALQHRAIGIAGLPGVHLFSIYRDDDVFTRWAIAVGPVFVGIYFGIQTKFGQ